MVDAGNELAEISAETTAQMVALGDEVIAEWIADVTAKGLDGAGLVASARAKVAANRLPAN